MSFSSAFGTVTDALLDTGKGDLVQREAVIEARCFFPLNMILLAVEKELHR